MENIGCQEILSIYGNRYSANWMHHFYVLFKDSFELKFILSKCGCVKLLIYLLIYPTDIL
jgi:hypothetical protein